MTEVLTSFCARIEALERRQRLLEAIVGGNVSAQIDAAIVKEAAIHIDGYPSMIGGVEIPEGWEPTVEGSQLVFRKKKD